MDSGLTLIGLPVALGIIMLGLGLGLTTGDFRRVAQHPKAAVLAFDLPPGLAVGMMLLAASPGGATATCSAGTWH